MSSALSMLLRTFTALGEVLVRVVVQAIVLALAFVLVLGVVTQYALIVLGHGQG